MSILIRANGTRIDPVCNHYGFSFGNGAEPRRDSWYCGRPAGHDGKHGPLKGRHDWDSLPDVSWLGISGPQGYPKLVEREVARLKALGHPPKGWPPIRRG